MPGLLVVQPFVASYTDKLRNYNIRYLWVAAQTMQEQCWY